MFLINTLFNFAMFMKKETSILSLNIVNIKYQIIICNTNSYNLFT